MTAPGRSDPMSRSSSVMKSSTVAIAPAIASSVAGVAAAGCELRIASSTTTAKVKVPRAEPSVCRSIGSRRSWSIMRGA